MNRRFYKIMYRLGMLKPYSRIDRLRYLNRLRKGKKSPQDQWAYVEDDFRQAGRGDVLICSPFRGLRLFFYCNPISKVERTIIADGLYNPAALNLAEIFLVPDGILLDIGANVGSFGLPLAKAHPEIEVHAYEPNPSAVKRLQKNISTNRVKNVAVRNLAVGKQSGELEFWAFENGDLGLSSFLSPVQTGSRKITVKVIRLDDLYPSETQVCLIKTDTQGYEFEVLEGARGLIQRGRPPILLEHEDALFASKRDAEQVRMNLKALFSDLGYEVFYLSKKDPFLFFPVQWDCILNGDLLALPLMQEGK
jgi:FkbM family methyltransferase